MALALMEEASNDDDIAPNDTFGSQKRKGQKRSNYSFAEETDGVETRGQPINDVIRGQFHQHFTCIFYARRSQKRQKESQVAFCAFEISACAKAARKMLVKLTPERSANNKVRQKESKTLFPKFVRI